MDLPYIKINIIIFDIDVAFAKWRQIAEHKTRQSYYVTLELLILLLQRYNIHYVFVKENPQFIILRLTDSNCCVLTCELGGARAESV